MLYIGYPKTNFSEVYPLDIATIHGSELLSSVAPNAASAVPPPSS